MIPEPVVVLGGGLSGMAAAYGLAAAGVRRVTLIERGAELGGLAGTFEMDGHFYPLGYHHILHRDRTLLYFLAQLGVLEQVRWRKIRMLFRLGSTSYDLARPADFLRFPMRLTDKLRFVRLMLRSFNKRDWREWHGRAAEELLDSWAGPGVRQALFEPLCRLKFDLPARDVSAAWLGARLHFREGSAPLGYIPGRNWTQVLCHGLSRRLDELGVNVRLRTTVRGIVADGARVTAVECADGGPVEVGTLISTLPTAIYHALLPADDSPALASIRYTALLSVICATRQRLVPEFYWMNLASLDYQSCGIFLLHALNPTIGAPGTACVNFVTHLSGREQPLFARSDEELLAGYADDFRRVFGQEFDPFWTRINRIPLYSPVFDRDYRNPPPASTRFANVHFAGNYRTFPSVASTGTALQSGLEAAEFTLRQAGRTAGLAAAASGYRLRGMPRS